MKKIAITTLRVYKCRRIKYFSVFIILLISLSTSYSQSGWISQEIGTRKYLVINFINNSTGFILSEDKTILKTTNLGLSWNTIPSNIIHPSPARNGKFLNDSVYALFLTNQIFVTTNYGLSWNYNSINPIGSGAVRLNGLEILNQHTAFVCGTDFGMIGPSFYVDGIIFKTTNSGINWIESFRGGVEFYDIKFKDEQDGAVKGVGFWKTFNGGSSWEYISGLPSYYGKMTDPFTDTIYTSDARGFVIGSIDSGNSFHDIPTGNTRPLRNIFFVDSKKGYVIGDSGLILYTSNAGINWQLQNSGTTKNLYGIWFVNKDTGFVVGDSGIVLTTLTGGLVSAPTQQTFVPSEFELYQNYPNPFNPATSIKFNIKFSSDVKLIIYDALGREINILLSERLKPGNYTVHFDGSQNSSGVFIYKLIAGNYTESKKMLLVK